VPYKFGASQGQWLFLSTITWFAFLNFFENFHPNLGNLMLEIMHLFTMPIPLSLKTVTFINILKILYKNEKYIFSYDLLPYKNSKALLTL
jgi:hypothetical protein